MPAISLQGSEGYLSLTWCEMYLVASDHSECPYDRVDDLIALGKLFIGHAPSRDPEDTEEAEEGEHDIR